jgi:hypothetical protein
VLSDAEVIGQPTRISDCANLSRAGNLGFSYPPASSDRRGSFRGNEAGGRAQSQVSATSDPIPAWSAFSRKASRCRVSNGPAGAFGGIRRGRGGQHQTKRRPISAMPAISACSRNERRQGVARGSGRRVASGSRSSLSRYGPARDRSRAPIEDCERRTQHDHVRFLSSRRAAACGY